MNLLFWQHTSRAAHKHPAVATAHAVTRVVRALHEVAQTLRDARVCVVLKARARADVCPTLGTRAARDRVASVTMVERRGAGLEICAWPRGAASGDTQGAAAKSRNRLISRGGPAILPRAVHPALRPLRGFAQTSPGPPSPGHAPQTGAFCGRALLW